MRRSYAGVAVVFLVVLLGCSQQQSPEPEEFSGEVAIATFAGGCFWCMEAAFEDLPDVINVVSGYSGGHLENPTYRQVISGTTGHLETVQITYDPAKGTYEEQLDFFWEQIDPTDDAGQFVDRGSQYRTAIFYHDEEQKALAEESRAEMDASGRFDKPIVTQILPFEIFYEAEEYHQDYAKKRVLQYTLYVKGSGRTGFRKRFWND